MAEKLRTMREAVLEIAVLSFHVGMTTLAKCNQVRKLIGVKVAHEVLESYNVVNFKALFSRPLATPSALVVVACPGKSSLLFPIRAIIRLIPSLPRRGSLWCFPHPVIPTARRTKAKSGVLVLAGSCIRLRTVFADSLISSAQQRIRLALLGSRQISLVFRGHLASFASISSMLVKIAIPAIFESTLLPCYLRREYIDRFTTINAVIGNALFHNLIITRREDKCHFRKI